MDERGISIGVVVDKRPSSLSKQGRPDRKQLKKVSVLKNPKKHRAFVKNVLELQNY